MGNALLGRLADRAKSQLYLYGWLKIGVGLFAALSPALLRMGLSEAYVQIARASGLTGGGLLAAKIVVAALALLPPTILMGGTLPAWGALRPARWRRCSPRLRGFTSSTASAPLPAAWWRVFWDPGLRPQSGPDARRRAERGGRRGGHYLVQARGRGKRRGTAG